MICAWCGFFSLKQRNFIWTGDLHAFVLASEKKNHMKLITLGSVSLMLQRLDQLISFASHSM